LYYSRRTFNWRRDPDLTITGGAGPGERVLIVQYEELCQENRGWADFCTRGYTWRRGVGWTPARGVVSGEEVLDGIQQEKLCLEKKCWRGSSTRSCA
jgi:hypothetical protein